MRNTWTIMTLAALTLTVGAAFAQHGGHGGGGHGGGGHAGGGHPGGGHPGGGHPGGGHPGGGHPGGGTSNGGRNNGGWNNGGNSGRWTVSDRRSALVRWHHHRRGYWTIVGPAVWPGVVDTAVVNPATYGVQITQLFAGPAARAGLRPGDTIVAVNGYSTPTIDTIRDALNGETADARVDYITESGEQAVITVAAVEGRIGIDGQTVQLN